MTRDQLEAIESDVQTAALLVPPGGKAGDRDAIRFAIVVARALRAMADEIRRLRRWSAP